MAACTDPIQISFEQAVREFERSLSDKDAWAEIQKTKSIDDIYDLTDQLQKQQAKTNTMRGLTKIDPFLKGLNSYAGVIETFTQAKSDVLSLIWGPIKLLIHLASTLKQSFDALLNTTAEIGQILPEFQSMARLFGHNKQIQDILLLFFKDILDFYTVALNFFHLPRWKFCFEILWPKHKEKIKLVMVHIERHTSLFRNQVGLEHIRGEHEARVKALQHFEDTEKANIRQEFHAIKSDISPQLHGYTLARVRSCVCSGTGAWLAGSASYRNWLDPKDTSNRVLWIQGIPGAGKTYLSSIIIDEAAQLGQTSYAFLSYTSKSDVTALHILHTLIFELVSQNESLQGVFCSLSRETMKSNAEVSVEVLKQLIEYVGFTYLIVDGLDEIDGFERNQILSHLIRLTTDCEEARLLVSSRAESDIARLLKDRPMIRVDAENTTSLQSFVEQRSDIWLQAHSFDNDTEMELKNLLKPLASKAKGMFLYVNVVFQSIELLEDPDEIREELNVLPENLDDAYARIVKRIDNLKPPALVKKAHKILSMIVASPLPLKVHELEQLLKIEPYDIDGTAEVRASLDISAICGPIVEIVDEQVQFVHFTVQEYLTSSHLRNPIDKNVSVLRLTECCVTYLCQRHHDSTLDGDEIDDHILKGQYRLHYYAYEMWYSLVQLCIEAFHQEHLLDSLINLLEIMSPRRLRPAFDEPIEPDTSLQLERALGNSQASVRLLRNADKFANTRRNGNLRRGHGTEWWSFDPTTLSKTSSQVYMRTKKMLCTTQQHLHGCHCEELTRHYGKYKYKCAKVSCHFARHGFISHSLCDLHEKSHKKSWTCEYPDCSYASQAFLSRRMRDDHQKLSHSIQSDNLKHEVNVDDRPGSIAFFYDLIDNNDSMTLKRYEAQLERLGYKEQCHLFDYAIGKRKIECVSFLPTGRRDEIYRWTNCAAVAVHCRDKVNFESFLSRMAGCNAESRYDIRRGSTIVAAFLSTYTSDLWNIWTQWCQSSASPFRAHKHVLLIHTSTGSIRGTESDPVKEDMLLAKWTELGFFESPTKRHLGHILPNIASSTCSTRLAGKLMELVGDNVLNLSDRSDESHFTALQIAGRRSSAKAAEMMRFLLFKGADPNPGQPSGRKDVRDELGARNIHKWLGVTWDELVAQAKAQLGDRNSLAEHENSRKVVIVLD